ncbi:hypothetical protein FACS189447_10990 [Spirochaetia bacterium]|nr:hypothetical protein FACS189447_10990 [Spirochaetia bacterium]
MQTVYKVFAQIYPAQCNRVIVHTNIFKEEAPELPAAYLKRSGNFYTLRRWFLNQEKAIDFIAYLELTFSKGPAKNPILDGDQLDLFQEVSK